MCRHKELRLRTPATLSLARKGSSSRKCINSYFDILEQTLEEKTLEESTLYDYPALIFNMDESGFPLYT